MFFQKHVIKPDRIARQTDLRDGRYPIGMSIDKFMDFFYDCKKISVDGFVNVDESLTSAGGSSLIELLNAINTQNSGGTSGSFSGTSQRRIKPTGILNSDGSEPSINELPNTVVDYPYFSAGNNVGYVIIDLGESLFYEGLIYPYIEIRFAAGLSNYAGGSIIGSFSFANYGSISIYDGGLAGANLVAAGGSIDIIERYSEIELNQSSVAPGGQVIVSSDTCDLSIYDKAYFGPAVANLAPSARQITITVPAGARSGPIRLDSYREPDTFLTYQSLRILSSS